MTNIGDEELEEAANDLFAPLGAFMTRPIAEIGSDASLRVAAETMAEDGLGALVVMGPDGPTRIVTERDILLALADDGDPR